MATRPRQAMLGNAWLGRPTRHGWHSWDSLLKPSDRQFAKPVVERNADGHLEVSAPGDGACCNRWQLPANGNEWRKVGWNEKPPPRLGPPDGLTWLEAALDVEGRLEVFLMGQNGAVWHIWQTR